MDALALLCSLHADGPATLKNLRQAGCATLEAIETMEEERLSRVLGGPPAVARRFAREARHLRERLEPTLLDREEPHADPVAVATVPVPEVPVEAERDPMADVLEAWRERDATEASEILEPVETAEDEVPPRPVRARPEFEFGAEIVAAMRDLTSTVTPDGPLVSTPPPLAETISGILEGSAAELRERLAEEGVRDLRELTDADVLSLSKRLGFGYTRILRIVQLARLEAIEVVPTAPPDPAPKLSPAERPRSSSPSILELEWNLELRPQAPPRRDVPDPVMPELRPEGSGGPFA